MLLWIIYFIQIPIIFSWVYYKIDLYDKYKINKQIQKINKYIIADNINYHSVCHLILQTECFKITINVFCIRFKNFI